MPSDPHFTRFAQRLSAYSATASIVLAFPPSAGAQIVYTDLDPDVILDTSTLYPIDFDGDGQVDVSVQGRDYVSMFFDDDDPMRSSAFLGFTYSRRSNAYNRFGPWYFLNPGSKVGLDNPNFIRGVQDFGSYVPRVKICSVSETLPCEFFDGGSIGFGVGLDADPTTIYSAWMRVRVVPQNFGTSYVLIIQDYAYDTVPNSTLVLGQTERFIVLDRGDLDSFVHVVGDPITYAARLRNESAETRTIALRARGVRGTLPDFLHDFDPVTLAPGEETDLTLTTQIPLDSPDGSAFIAFEALADGGPAYESTLTSKLRIDRLAFDGTIDPDTVPASGGTVTFTGEVSNPGPDALAYDLWVVLLKEDGIVAEEVLGSGSLAVGGSDPLSASFDIPPTLPPGAYDLVFRVGDYGEGRAYSRLKFAITKALGTAQEPGAEGLTATHTLSDVAPNPTNQTATMTLDVAEAQAVRVEVLDALGRRVAVLHDGMLAAGVEQRLLFDGSRLPSGVYAVRVVGATFADTRIVTLKR